LGDEARLVLKMNLPAALRSRSRGFAVGLTASLKAAIELSKIRDFAPDFAHCFASSSIDTRQGGRE
jgi:hypothetical protein